MIVDESNYAVRSSFWQQAQMYYFWDAAVKCWFAISVWYCEAVSCSVCMADHDIDVHDHLVSGSSCTKSKLHIWKAFDLLHLMHCYSYQMFQYLIQVRFHQAHETKAVYAAVVKLLGSMASAANCHCFNICLLVIHALLICLMIFIIGGCLSLIYGSVTAITSALYSPAYLPEGLDGSLMFAQYSRSSFSLYSSLYILRCWLVWTELSAENASICCGCYITDWLLEMLPVPVYKCCCHRVACLHCPLWHLYTG